MTLWDHDLPDYERSSDLNERPSDWARYQVHILASGGPFLDEISPRLQAFSSRHPEAAAIWVAAFEIIGQVSEMLRKGHAMDLGEATIFVVSGELIFLDISGIEPKHDLKKGLSFDGAPKPRRLPPRTYLVILLPVTEAIDGGEIEPWIYRNRVQALLSLILVTSSRNVALRPVFENVSSVDDDQTSAFSDEIDTLQSRKGNGLTIASIDSLPDAVEALSSLGDDDRRRIVLSLRWFGKSRVTAGVDSFLNLWIALETLAMPDTSNIRPVVTTLAEAYGISPSEAADQFQIGRLFGLRGKIVHEGRHRRPSPAVLLVLESVYVDVFKHLLALKPTREAESALADRASEIWRSL